jgi:hypothetical protein
MLAEVMGKRRSRVSYPANAEPRLVAIPDPVNQEL